MTTNTNPSTTPFDRAAAIVTFVASLVAITVPAVGYVHDHWLRRDVSLSAHIVQSTPDTMSIHVFNHGSVGVVVTTLAITSDALGDIVVGAKLPRGGQLVEPGKDALVPSAPSHLNAVVKTDAESLARQPAALPISTTACSAHLGYIDGTGKPGTMTLPYDCYAASIIPTQE